MTATLDDIEIGTIFSYDGDKYEKGSSGTFGEKGYTVCHPLKGGQIQRKEKFHTKILNNAEISVY